MKNKKIWLGIMAAVLIVGVCVLCVTLSRKNVRQMVVIEKGDCVAQSGGEWERIRRETNY